MIQQSLHRLVNANAGRGIEQVGTRRSQSARERQREVLEARWHVEKAWALVGRQV